MKDAIQSALDRVYYRDRYDYRRALVGFARDLNSDLDLLRLSERLVHRVTETLLVDRMALMLAPVSVASDAGDFVTIAHAGFPDAPPRLTRTSDVGTRLISGHTLTLDDAFALRRLDAREGELWREAGIHYFVPCVSKEGTIAVMALGRKASAEPLSSEDMALLSAVAAQAATALENGRLYRQLRTKADEVERMRQFSENILESLNDGLAVLDRTGGSSAGTAGWKSCTACVTKTPSAAPSISCSTHRSSRCSAPARSNRRKARPTTACRSPRVTTRCAGSSSTWRRRRCATRTRPSRAPS